MDESNTEESRWQQELQRQKQEQLDEATRLMQRIRVCLVRWAARYAESPHARRSVAETNKLIGEIDKWSEPLPRNVKD
jgi:hypothetical protein